MPAAGQISRPAINANGRNLLLLLPEQVPRPVGHGLLRTWQEDGPCFTFARRPSRPGAHESVGRRSFQSGRSWVTVRPAQHVRSRGHVLVLPAGCVRAVDEEVSLVEKVLDSVADGSVYRFHRARSSIVLY